MRVDGQQDGLEDLLQVGELEPDLGREFEFGTASVASGVAMAAGPEWAWQNRHLSDWRGILLEGFGSDLVAVLDAALLDGAVALAADGTTALFAAVNPALTAGPSARRLAMVGAVASAGADDGDLRAIWAEDPCESDQVGAGCVMRATCRPRMVTLMGKGLLDVQAPPTRPEPVLM
jgi:hypothetical protein